VRGAVQQEQSSSLDHAPRRRGNSDPSRDPIRDHQLAFEPEIRPLARCFQDFHHVSLIDLRVRPDLSDNHTRNPNVWDDITFPSEAVKKEIQQYISSKLTPHPTKVRADIEVTCFGYDGIDAVKDALRTAEADNTPENQIKVKLVAPPLYVLASQCLDKTHGVKMLEEAILKIEERIKANGGNCTVKMAPKAVTEHDDAILQELMEKRERENMQVSGDEDSESDEGVPE
jgi:hypothetical protein